MSEPTADLRSLLEQTSGRLFASSLLTEEEIVANSAIYDQPCGIYFLISGQSVVYVGQSRTVMSRLASHFARIRFSRFAFLPVEERYLDIVESIYIHLLRPKFNGSEMMMGEKRVCAPMTIQRLMDLAMAGLDSLPQSSRIAGSESTENA